MFLIREGVWEVHLRGTAPDFYRGTLSSETAAEWTRCLQQIYKDCALAETAILVQFPFWRRVALGLRDAFGSKILFDLMDDWEHWPTEPKISDANIADQRALVQEADVLVVTARQLFERYRDNCSA